MALDPYAPPTTEPGTGPTDQLVALTAALGSVTWRDDRFSKTSWTLAWDADRLQLQDRDGTPVQDCALNRPDDRLVLNPVGIRSLLVAPLTGKGRRQVIALTPVVAPAMIAGIGPRRWLHLWANSRGGLRELRTWGLVVLALGALPLVAPPDDAPFALSLNDVCWLIFGLVMVSVGQAVRSRPHPVCWLILGGGFALVAMSTSAELSRVDGTMWWVNLFIIVLFTWLTWSTLRTWVFLRSIWQGEHRTVSGDQAG